MNRLAIRPARQHDRNLRAYDDRGCIRTGQERELLGQHIAGHEVRHDEDVGPSRKPPT